MIHSRISKGTSLGLRQFSKTTIIRQSQQTQKKSWEETYAPEKSIENGTEEIFEDDKTEPPVHVSSTLTKRFQIGETYNPFDFSLTKIKMDRLLRNKELMNEKIDVFERTGINPKDLYFMPEILSKYLTSTGQIMSREQTGLSVKNHRLLSHAIRTARSLGILSTVHRYSSFLPSRNI